jgi:hypothetical protein
MMTMELRNNPATNITLSELLTGYTLIYASASKVYHPFDDCPHLKNVRHPPLRKPLRDGEEVWMKVGGRSLCERCAERLGWRSADA